MFWRLLVESNREIYDRIPHRPPFLWVDKILSIGIESIETEKTFPEDLDIFKGHYPNYPIVPGAILCEALFQSGALLISEILPKDDTRSKGTPVLTRILGAKFKRQVHSGETVTMHVKFQEEVGPAWFFRGKLQVNDKTAVIVEFACTLTG